MPRKRTDPPAADPPAADPPAAGPKAADPTRRILDAAMALAAERGWRDLPLSDVAARAEVPLGDLLRRFPSKAAILGGVGRIADDAMLEADAELDAGEPVRDRVFDRVMRRFDALLPFRPGLARIYEELPRDPLPLLALLPRLGRSMAWTLEAAGLSAAGLRGIARTKALSLIYLRAMRVWFEDESADLSRTMASLDGQLRRLEEYSSLLGSRRTQRRAPESDATAT
jgi:AcrR family transcriptional regulator